MVKDKDKTKSLSKAIDVKAKLSSEEIEKQLKDDFEVHEYLNKIHVGG